MNTIIEIKVYNPQVDQSGAIYVIQLSSNIYRAEENELFLELTKGTEFEREPMKTEHIVLIRCRIREKANAGVGARHNSRRDDALWLHHGRRLGYQRTLTAKN